MSEDVAVDLINDVNTAFQNNCIKDTKLARLSDKLSDGNVTYSDAYSYATSIGNARAKAFKSQISPNDLPDGRMYYNIASRLLENTLGEDYKLVSEFAQKVQKVLNEKSGISLNALKADKDNDRIKGFIDRISSEEDFSKIAWILDEPVKVHALSVVDDTIKKNTEFQNKSGVGVKVVRIAEANCCKWCADLDGTYSYPGVPGDVFARHDNCRCIVEYDGHKLSAYESKNGANTFRDQENLNIETRKTYDSKNNDLMGEVIKEKITFRDDKGKIVEREFRVHQSDVANNIFTQTNTRDAQKICEYLNNSVNNGDYGDLDSIIVVKNNTLGGISSYDHTKKTLYISEELIDPEKFSKLVDTSYFSADNIDDVIKHELGGHKTHWDSVKAFYNDNRDRFSNLSEAKNEFEQELFRYVNQAQQQEATYLIKHVSEYAFNSFTNYADISNRLNEVIAESVVKIQEIEKTDSYFAKLIRGVML